MAAERSNDMAMSRRSALLGAAVIVAGMSAPAGAAPQSGAAGGPLGVNGGANGLEFLGEISQVGEELTGYGFFTAVNGLSADQVFFASGAPSEATARFTFHATARLTSLQRRGDLFVAHADGQLEIYLRDNPGASFDDPSSFAQGQRVAVDDASLENITNVTAPDTAVVTVFGDLRRTDVARFRLGNATYQLGRVGLRSRLVAPGKGTRLEPVAPRAILIVGGNISNPEPGGGPGN